MLCANCLKLAVRYTSKTCIRCQGIVNQHIYVICEGCSSQYKQCAICLKKVESGNKKPLSSGCNSCRR